MKIALLSDIHGNQYALESVIKAIKQYGITEIIVLGDIVGYYYRPDVVLKLLEDFRTTYIRGNHEVMLQNLINNELNLEEIRKKYGSGLSLALDYLSRDQIQTLISLPDCMICEREGVRFTLCHGSPWDPNQYIYPDASIEILDKCVACVNTDFVLLGHTHYPFVTTRQNVTIINPGSVGQPRDQSVGASWAIINTDNKSVVFKQTSYNRSHLIEDVTQIDPDILFLKEVLIRKQR